MHLVPDASGQSPHTAPTAGAGERSAGGVAEPIWAETLAPCLLGKGRCRQPLAASNKSVGVFSPLFFRPPIQLLSRISMAVWLVSGSLRLLWCLPTL